MFVCKDCFGEAGLRHYVEDNATETYCEFCDADAGEELISMELEALVSYMRQSLMREYDNAGNCLPYESAEGGFQGITYDAYDLLTDIVPVELPNDTSGRLLDELVGELSDIVWCDRSPFSLNSLQLATFSWERFERTVKHQRRFYFHKVGLGDADEALAPGELLERIFDYADRVGMFRTIESGLVLYRVRQHEESGGWKTAAQLGPPPEAKAVQSNRMSPPGIVMFYGSEAHETALRETAHVAGGYSVARFRTTRPITVLDFAQLPNLPSIFEEVPDTMEVDPRRALKFFLEHVAERISLPVVGDNRIHVDYVPTQVVTEFVRTESLVDGLAVDGIRYSSAVHPGHSSCVLFATQENIHGIGTDAASTWLELVDIEDITVTDEQMATRKEVVASLSFEDDTE